VLFKSCAIPAPIPIFEEIFLFFHEDIPATNYSHMLYIIAIFYFNIDI